MSVIHIEDLEIEVIHKRIKNIHLRVYPPEGRIKVSVPPYTSRKFLLSFLHSKTEWIRKQKRKIGTERETLHKEFVQGEPHYYQGREYTLDVRDSSHPSVEIEGNSLVISLRPGHDRIKREKLLDDWMRQQLKEQIPPIIRRYETIMGVEVNFFGVKKMKTRWGSCNIRAGRIWLNLELAKKDPLWLESVVVHEMVHLLEASHNKRFYTLMDKYFPRWRVVRGEM